MARATTSASGPRRQASTARCPSRLLTLPAEASSAAPGLPNALSNFRWLVELSPGIEESLTQLSRSEPSRLTTPPYQCLHGSRGWKQVSMRTDGPQRHQGFRTMSPTLTCRFEVNMKPYES